MPIPLIGAGIAAGASILGNVLSNKSQRNAEDRQRQWNEQMYQRQHDDNLKLWEMQNAYNDPSAQMARLEKAGLNPNLIYGGKGGTGNSASMPASADMKALDTRAQTFEGVSKVIDTFMNIKAKNAQIDNIEEQNLTAMQDRVLKSIDSLGGILQVSRDKKGLHTQFDKESRFESQKYELGKSQANYNKAMVIQKGIENRYWDKMNAYKTHGYNLDNLLKTFSVNIGNKIPLGKLLIDYLGKK